MPAPKGHAPYPGCEKGGRPLKFTKDFIESEAEAFLEWMKEKVAFGTKILHWNEATYPINFQSGQKLMISFPAFTSSRKHGSNQSLLKEVS